MLSYPFSCTHSGAPCSDTFASTSSRGRATRSGGCWDRPTTASSHIISNIRPLTVRVTAKKMSGLGTNHLGQLSLNGSIVGLSKQICSNRDTTRTCVWSSAPKTPTLVLTRELAPVLSESRDQNIEPLCRTLNQHPIEREEEIAHRHSIRYYILWLGFHNVRCVVWNELLKRRVIRITGHIIRLFDHLGSWEWKDLVIVDTKPCVNMQGLGNEACQLTQLPKCQRQSAYKCWQASAIHSSQDNIPRWKVDEYQWCFQILGHRGGYLLGWLNLVLQLFRGPS